MNPEQGQPKGLVTVSFPESGATVEARRIRPQDIKDGGVYLVDKRHNADEILELIVGDEPLPKGRWQVEE